MASLSPLIDQKRRAAEAAVAEIEPGMLVGLGTGSTAAFAIAALGRRVAGGLAVRAVATSLATEAAAVAAGIAMLDFADVAAVDLVIDGADEVDPALRAIKGAGGALLREKIVAESAGRMLCIIDDSKRVSQLGRGPLPVEVLPFARRFVTDRLAALGCEPVLRVRAGAPVLSDQGNLLIDCRFGPIDAPAALADQLAALPGVMGHGLFLREIDFLFCGGELRQERDR
ncbi:ribose-5-phosphate isomerase RpiA [Sphingomonas morindae]|uniref:Ribose-5-phosphate isomerase A n=1 Tax=Sphingomonas morindae TaxID=1541170 RepID=A0ABY4X6B0_9SPHN|nr:ribose-5-phosphate isomerase RpiA [Sphingomonas morindae]USI72421.1 ribose-5-phosphate isomerase RpiA [Sphingomonas morindae]